MPDIPMEPCPECGTPFWRYGRRCPACQEIRWTRWLRFIHPDRGEMSIITHGLGRSSGEHGGVVLTTMDPEAAEPWTTFSKPFGDAPVKPVGYFWEHEWTGEEISDEDFPMTHAAQATKCESPAQHVQTSAQEQPIHRGNLDERAAIELKKNPALTYEQLARILGCNPGTLRNRRAYPLLAAVKASIRAERDCFRGGSSWHDRQSGGLCHMTDL